MQSAMWGEARRGMIYGKALSVEGPGLLGQGCMLTVLSRHDLVSEVERVLLAGGLMVLHHLRLRFRTLHPVHDEVEDVLHQHDSRDPSLLVHRPDLVAESGASEEGGKQG